MSQKQNDRCKKCGAELTTQRFPIGYSVACHKAKCRGTGDDLTYHLTPEAAEKYFRERRKSK